MKRDESVRYELPRSEIYDYIQHLQASSFLMIWISERPYLLNAD